MNFHFRVALKDFFCFLKAEKTKYLIDMLEWLFAL
jgi:hypothetical protein